MVYLFGGFLLLSLPKRLQREVGLTCSRVAAQISGLVSSHCKNAKQAQNGEDVLFFRIWKPSGTMQFGQWFVFVVGQKNNSTTRLGLEKAGYFASF